MKSIVGVVHVPVIGIMAMSSGWRKVFSYPEPSRRDWSAIAELRGSIPSSFAEGSSLSSLGQREEILSSSHCLKVVKSLSFFEFLYNTMIDEAKTFAQAGIRHLILDFSVDKWFDEPSVYWAARILADLFKSACGDDIRIGIRMDNDEWASDIGSRLGYDAVFCTDSCSCYDVEKIRNRMTDGTDKKKPIVFMQLFLESEYTQYTKEYLLSRMPEGIFVTGNNEDAIDGLGKLVAGLNSEFGIGIPIAGKYFEEVVRGEMRHDMDGWGARNYIVIDKEARANECQNCAIDAAKLASICEEIAKFE